MSDGVETATERDIDRMGGDLPGSALAETALALARELDSGKNSATSKSMCARALLDTMAQLRELAPPREDQDDVDQLAARRERRRAAARGAGAADQSRS
jgi:hypothetical protein